MSGSCWFRNSITVGAASLALLAVSVGCGTDDGFPTPQRNAVASPSATIIVTPPSDQTPTPPLLLVTPVPTLVGEETPPPFEPVPEPLPGDPFQMVVASDLGEPFTAQQLVAQFDVIVHGRVTEILPSLWTTPNGNRPENPHHSAPDQYEIITPVVLESLEEPIVTGKLPIVPIDMASLATADYIIIAGFGGQVGEDVLISDAPSQQFSVGDEVVVALSSHRYWNFEEPGMSATPRGPGWAVGQTYLVTPDGIATVQGGSGPVSQPVSELIREIRMAVGEVDATATPYPTAVPTVVSVLPTVGTTP